MRKQDFYYDLPKELIAQDPLKERSAQYYILLAQWRSGKIAARDAAQELEIHYRTFLRWAQSEEVY